MAQTSLGRMTIPAVIFLIALLAYGSQILFHYIEPSPLSGQDTLLFNLLVACIWITYARACLTNVGWVPLGWTSGDVKENDDTHVPQRRRWCRKCEAPKPPRAHHCKTCSKCVPKMDHHCPWTASCVSHRTFPHFFRFLIYSVVSMCYLAYFLYVRGAVLWEGRSLPSYLGPTTAQIILLFILFGANSLTLFVLGILLIRNVWCLGANITTIEGWEIERHEALLRRARKHGGYLDGPDGIRVKITKQEFPYDIGIYQNIRQAMGTSFIFWLWPFAATPSNESGLSFKINGFEESSTSWPPPDPDRMYRKQMDFAQGVSFESLDDDYIQAFRKRQNQDFTRLRQQSAVSLGQRRVQEGFDPNASHESLAIENLTNNNDVGANKLAWRDSEGERLEDFGVDDAVDIYDEDEIPLVQLIQKRKANQPARTTK